MIIKDALLINNNLFLKFWAKAMETTNYLQNQLLTKSQRRKILPEKAWSKKKPDMSYVRVFGSIVNVLIFKKKEI